jgi:catalase
LLLYLSDLFSTGRHRNDGVANKEVNYIDLQPGARWRSFDKERQQRFVGRVAMKLTSERVDSEVQRIWIDYWKQCDENLGKQIEEKVMQMAGQTA